MHVIIVFQRCKIFKMTFKIAAITGLGNHMVFAMIIFVMEMFCLCSGNRIHQSMRHALSRPLLAGCDNTIISYNSHKNTYFGKTFIQKMK